MKMKNSYLLLFLFAYCQGMCQSLEALLQQIPNQNLSLKVLEKDYEVALEKVNQIQPRPDPEFGLGVFPLPVETRLGGQAVRLSAMQQFPWFGSVESQREIELARAKIEQGKIAVQEWELAYQLEQAYYELYEISRRRALLKRQVGLLHSLEQLTLAKVESGQTTAADVLQVQLEIETLQQEIAILKTKLSVPTITINQILNRPLTQSVDLIDSLSFITLPIDRTELYEQIATQYPLLQLFELGQEAARQQIAANEIADKPTFGIGLDYILLNKRSDANPVHNGRDILQIKAMVRLPLYKEKYTSKEKEELLKIESLEQQMANTISQIKAEIERAYALQETAALQVAFSEKQIVLTKATIRILEADYSANGDNFAELLQLQRALVTYDLKILEAIVQSHLADLAIRKYYKQGDK